MLVENTDFGGLFHYRQTTTTGNLFSKNNADVFSPPGAIGRLNGLNLKNLAKRVEEFLDEPPVPARAREVLHGSDRFFCGHFRRAPARRA